jgi:hypothetical protein
LVLEYVKEQIFNICLEAVKQDGLFLQYVQEQTFEICHEAIKQNDDAVKYVSSNILLMGFEKSIKSNI